MKQKENGKFCGVILAGRKVLFPEQQESGIL